MNNVAPFLRMFIAQSFEPLLIVVVQLMHNYSCLLLVDACFGRISFVGWIA